MRICTFILALAVAALMLSCRNTGSPPLVDAGKVNLAGTWATRSTDDNQGLRWDGASVRVEEWRFVVDKYTGQVFKGTYSYKLDTEVHPGTHLTKESTENWLGVDFWINYFLFSIFLHNIFFYTT